MQKIRIGHIGTKHDHSPGKLQCVQKYPEIFEIVGIVENDPVQRAIAQKDPCYDGLQWMTEDELFAAGVDAVMCEGHEHDLPFDALRWLERGVHVHMDKPAGRDLEVFKKTLQTAKSRNLTLQMAYMYRYNPAVMECLKKVRSGELGDIFSVTAIMNTDHPADKRDWMNQFLSGDMFFLGCHMVDLIFMMQGTPDKITPYIKSTMVEGVEAPDLTMAVLEYPHGLSTAWAVTPEVGGWHRRQLVVCGSKGTYEIRPLELPTYAYYTSRTEQTGSASLPEPKNRLPVESLDEHSRYDGMMLDFAKMVRGEKKNPFSYEYEYQLQKLVLASCGLDVDYHTEETI